jgi:hypothetical protein
MPVRPRVFLSSTSDLAEERRLIAAGLEKLASFYLFEDDRARGDSPKNRCREMIEDSHVLVCLLGGRFGSVYRLGGPGGTPQSIVEWEMETARSTHRVEIMPFEKTPLVEIEKDQQAVLERIRNFTQGAWLKPFRGPDNVVSVVQQSLVDWVAEFTARTLDEQRRLRQRQAPWLRVLALLAVGAVLAVAVSPLQSQFSSRSLAGFAIAAFSLVALAFVFDKRSRR